MSEVHLSSLQFSTSVPLPPVTEIHSWYAIRTRSNHEHVAASALTGQGLSPYLPKYRSRRRWSDRVVETELPLFPGYVFCRFNPRNRLPILKTPGVFSIIGFANEPAPIPDDEIAAVQSVLESGRFTEPCPYLREGQRIRVVVGSMEGLEGILLKKKSEWRMIISVNMLQRSISVEIDRESIATV